MRDVYEVLRQKELEVWRLTKEVAALRIAAPLVSEGGEAKMTASRQCRNVGQPSLPVPGRSPTRAPAAPPRFCATCGVTPRCRHSATKSRVSKPLSPPSPVFPPESAPASPAPRRAPRSRWPQTLPHLRSVTLRFSTSKIPAITQFRLLPSHHSCAPAFGVHEIV
jgi:hypothetical protein